uniref:Chromo domain-containing protein n=1 Tax=Anopheles dirus TaxID=7168 RepID=A0A182NPU9_9DIPT
MGKEIDPADIGKHPDLIKKAQSDIANCDVLVCGRCHSVFHLIELFSEHKESEPDCKRTSTSTLHECDEAQAKVWAFLLWKSAQRSATGEERSPSGTNNSWKLYQAWVKLEESVRDTWIVAGKTIQSFSKTGAGNLQEMPVKITKTIVETPNESQDKKPTGVVSAGNAQNRFAATIRKPAVEVAKPITVEPPKNRIIVGAAGKKLDAATPVKSTTGVGASSTPVKRSFATRTHPKTGVFGEEEVEKILAKRFSPIIKMHEYLVKWAKMANDQNTWEPLTHLHSCQSILEHFEVQLAKQKEQRAATAARALQQQRQEKGMGATGTSTTAAASATASSSPVKSATVSGIISNATSSVATIGSQLRPVRTSKASAMDRVKQWASGESTDDGGSGTTTTKRKLDEGESDPGLNDSDGVDASKKLRTESTSAVSEALSKVSQSGSVKIMSVSAQVAAAKTATVNGTAGSSPKDANAAEVVILKSPKDGVASGISKKPVGGVVSPGTSPISRLSPRTGEAAKVKIVTKSEPGAVHGIFKIKSESTGSSPQSSPKPAVATATVASAVSRPVTISSSSSTDSSGVTTRFIRRNVDGTEQLVKQTIRKTPKIVTSATATTPGGQQGRPGVGMPVAVRTATPGVTPIPKITTSAAIGQQQRNTIASPRVISTTQTKVGPGGKIITSTGTPSTMVRTSTVTRTPMASTAAQPPAASEQKINALRRQGLNVVKRVVTTTGATTTVVKKSEEDEAELMTERPATPPSPAPQHVLCPYTGKLLTEGETSEPVPSPKAEPEEKPADEKKASATDGAAAGEPSDQTDTQVQQLLTNEDGSPIFMAGEDGTLYQVAGKNAEGQTILIAQGADGEQHVLLTSQEGEEGSAGGGAGGDGGASGEGGSGVLTLDAAVSEAVAVQQEGQELTEEQAAQLQQSVETNQQLTIQTEDSQDAQITAEVVQADQPSPGGTRRVVLLLPDGSFMMTEVNDEHYRSLNLVN